ncbi:MAG: DUF726 domain-containing protein [Thermoguttaceae bacterium]|nr:DUF726 domain-containing protein [Thermoguttaceae bacterium]
MNEKDFNPESGLSANKRSLIFRWLKNHRELTGETVKNRNQLEQLTQKASQWLERFKGSFQGEAGKSLTTSIRMIRAWLTGRYPGISSNAIWILTAALLYFVSPLDAVPDMIPGIGMLDDIFVLGWAMRKISHEVRDFRRWERVQESIETVSRLETSNIKRLILCPGWLSGTQDYSELTSLFQQIYPKAEILIHYWKSNVSWHEACQMVDGSEIDRLLGVLDSKEVLPEDSALVGHSLGGRLTIRALARLDRKYSGQKKRPLFHHVLLFGTAMSNADPDIARVPQMTRHSVFNFFNKSDRVLGYLYQAMEQDPPLGLLGSKNEIPDFYNIKMSGTEEYLWDVAGNMVSVASLIASGKLFPTLTLSSEMIARLTLFHQHQFIEYAKFFEKTKAVRQE